MSHLTCPKCGSKEHTTGYGLAAGPMGAYTFCDGCDILLEFMPDTDGMDEEQEARQLARRDEYMKELWGVDWKSPNQKSNTSAGTNADGTSTSI